jgi:hypothetical protein
MTKMFVPCQGKTACRENNIQCLTCGRSLDEIYTTRSLIDALASFAHTMGYQNAETFFQYVSGKAHKKFDHYE